MNFLRLNFFIQKKLDGLKCSLQEMKHTVILIYCDVIKLDSSAVVTKLKVIIQSGEVG